MPVFTIRISNSAAKLLWVEYIYIFFETALYLHKFRKSDVELMMFLSSKLRSSLWVVLILNSEITYRLELLMQCQS